MSLYATLCGWRLRHFALSTFRLLVRRWHATVFLLLLLSPADMPLAEQVQLLASPVLQMVQPGEAARGAGLWVGMLLVAWSWSALQGQALAGGRAWTQLAAMPLPPRVLQRVDLTVLAIADLPLWLSFGAALVSLAAGPTPAAAQGVAVLALACQIPVVQCLALRRPRGVGACVLGSLAGFVAMGLAGSAWLLAVATVAGSVAGLVPGPRPLARTGGRTRRPALALRRQWSTRMNMAAIDLRFLFGAGALGRHFGLALTALLPPPLFVFLGGSVQPTVITIALLLLLPSLLFRVAGLALDLQRLHVPMQRLHASLGIPRGELFRVSLTLLAAGCAIASVPLALTLWRASGSPLALASTPIGVLAMAAMACLDRGGGRGGGRFVVRVALAALACLAVYGLL